MKWYGMDEDEDFQGILTAEDRFLDLENVEVGFDDGVPTTIIVELTNGTCVCFCSRHVDSNGTREQLHVSILKEEKSDV